LKATLIESPIAAMLLGSGGLAADAAPTAAFPNVINPITTIEALATTNHRRGAANAADVAVPVLLRMVAPGLAPW